MFKRYMYVITSANRYHKRELRYFNSNINQHTIGMLFSFRKAKKFIKKNLNTISDGITDTVIIEKVEFGLNPKAKISPITKWEYHIKEDTKGNPTIEPLVSDTPLSLESFFYKDELMECYTRAIYLIRKSMDSFNNSVLYGDEYSEIDYNYKRLRERLYDFCNVFFKFGNPEEHFTEDFIEINNKSILEEISIIDNNNKILLTLLSDKKDLIALNNMTHSKN